jgi:hypothetical protein
MKKPIDFQLVPAIMLGIILLIFIIVGVIKFSIAYSDVSTRERIKREFIDNAIAPDTIIVVYDTIYIRVNECGTVCKRKN